MRHLYQNFDINCSIFSRSVSGKKSGLKACIKIQNSENKFRIRGQGITVLLFKSLKSKKSLSE